MGIIEIIILMIVGALIGHKFTNHSKDGIVKDYEILDKAKNDLKDKTREEKIRDLNK